MDIYMRKTMASVASLEKIVEFWCWGLIFGGQGGPPDPPWIRPWPSIYPLKTYVILSTNFSPY